MTVCMFVCVRGEGLRTSKEGKGIERMKKKWGGGDNEQIAFGLPEYGTL